VAYSVKQRSDKGFDFFDPTGKKINVNQYVQATGANKADLVNMMAKQGDTVSQSYQKRQNILPSQFNAFSQPTAQTSRFSLPGATINLPKAPQNVIGPDYQPPKPIQPVDTMTSSPLRKNEFSAYNDLVSQYNNLSDAATHQKFLDDIAKIADKGQGNYQLAAKDLQRKLNPTVLDNIGQGIIDASGFDAIKTFGTGIGTAAAYTQPNVQQAVSNDPNFAQQLQNNTDPRNIIPAALGTGMTAISGSFANPITETGLGLLSKKTLVPTLTNMAKGAIGGGIAMPAITAATEAAGSGLATGKVTVDPNNVINSILPGMGYGALFSSKVPKAQQAVGKATKAVNDVRPSVIASQHPDVLGHDAQYADLAKKFDSLPASSQARHDVNVAMAENRASRLTTSQQIQAQAIRESNKPRMTRQQREGGFARIPGKKPVEKPYIINKINSTDVTKLSEKDLQYFGKQGYTSITDRYGNTRSVTPMVDKNVGKLNDLNPTGGVFVDYTPKKRATMPLGSDITTLDKTAGKASSEMVTIYRGAPKNQKGINPGDFITTNKELAKSYGDNVLEKQVPASHVLDSKSSPLGEEYLYRPTKPSSQAGFAKVPLNKKLAEFASRNTEPAPQVGKTPPKKPYTPLSQPRDTQPAIVKQVNKTKIVKKERGFIETIKADANTPEAIKSRVSSLYKVRNTQDLVTKSANLVKTNPDLARKVALNGSGDVEQAVGSELIKHYGKTGKIEEAIALARQVATKANENGRASQVLSAYSKLTPEGVLRFTQQEIDAFNKVNKRVGKNQIVLSKQKAQSLFDQSATLQNMAEGRPKDIAAKKMLNDAAAILPPGWVKKLSTLQTIGQLLNPKTAIRNIGGNTMFAGIENISQVGAAGIDKLASKITGSTRTTALPNLKTQLKSFGTNAKQSVEEINQNVNLGPDTQFELNQVPVFKSKFMQGIEKTLSYELRVSDRASYGAAFDDTVKGLMKVNKLTKPTQEILDQANANGLYRTFQDNSKAAQLFQGIKKALNNVGVEHNGARWGLGDLILKYPKTPGNILARGVDYSPVGIIKGLYQIIKPAITKQPFDQHSFANSLSRGVVGTGGIMGAGAVLGALGIITEKPSQDTDTRNLQKASGQGGYQINTSALVRFFGSGFNKDAAKLQSGDTLISYDWAQPMSIPLSAGAAIGKGQSALDGATSTVTNLTEGLNTLVEQPLLTGVSTFAGNIKNKGVIGAGLETAKGAPASFVPTISNQARQLSDNTTRSTYDPNGWNQAMNMVANKIPGVASSLKPQVDTLGNGKQNYQDGSNNILNVMFNPAFITKYNPNAAAKLPLDILARSGETQQMPRTTATSQSVNGATIKLTPQQNSDFQQYVGTKTSEYYNTLIADPIFMAKADTEKAKIMSSELTNISTAGKVLVLGDTRKLSAAETRIVNNTGVFKTTSSTAGVKLSPTETYQKHLADYNTAKKDGTLSGPKAYATEQSLAKEAITSKYPQEVLDFYNLSKANQNAYFNADRKKATELYDQAKLLDAQLVGNKFATTKFASTGGKKSSSKGGAKKSSKASIASYLAASRSMNNTSSSTYKALSSLLAGTTAKSSSSKPKSLGRKVALNKITVKRSTS